MSKPSEKSSEIGSADSSKGTAPNSTKAPPGFDVERAEALARNLRPAWAVGAKASHADTKASPPTNGALAKSNGARDVSPPESERRRSGTDPELFGTRSNAGPDSARGSTASFGDAPAPGFTKQVVKVSATPSVAIVDEPEGAAAPPPVAKSAATPPTGLASADGHTSLASKVAQSHSAAEGPVSAKRTSDAPPSSNRGTVPRPSPSSSKRTSDAPSGSATPLKEAGSTGPASAPAPGSPAPVGTSPGEASITPQASIAIQGSIVIQPSAAEQAAGEEQNVTAPAAIAEHVIAEQAATAAEAPGTAQPPATETAVLAPMPPIAVDGNVALDTSAVTTNPAPANAGTESTQHTSEAAAAGTASTAAAPAAPMVDPALAAPAAFVGPVPPPVSVRAAPLSTSVPPSAPHFAPPVSAPSDDDFPELRKKRSKGPYVVAAILAAAAVAAFSMLGGGSPEAEKTADVPTPHKAAESPKTSESPQAAEANSATPTSSTKTESEPTVASTPAAAAPANANVEKPAAHTVSKVSVAPKKPVAAPVKAASTAPTSAPKKPAAVPAPAPKPSKPKGQSIVREMPF